jgi:hypothetical protein
MMGNRTEPVAELELRLSVERALNTLSAWQLRLCSDLTDGSRRREQAASAQSRATFYRQLNDLRLCLLAAGLGPRT